MYIERLTKFQIDLAELQWRLLKIKIKCHQKGNQTKLQITYKQQIIQLRIS
jgi:hypothetical protein